MAKLATASKRPKRSATSTAEFKTNLPLLLRDSWLTILSRFGHLLEVDKIRTIEEEVARHLIKNNKPDLPRGVV
jgi:hypothetical protein